MKLFDELYNDIQSDLFKQMAETETGVIKSYRVALESVQQDLAALYRKHASDGKLYWTEMNRYKRLAALEENIRKELGKQLASTDSYIERQTIATFKDSFHRHAWAIDQDSGFAHSWGSLNDDAIDSVIHSPLSKFADSRALATARRGTVDKVRNEITLSLVRGESYKKMSQRIGQVLGFNENNRFVDAGAAYKSLRVARTEGQRVLVEGQQRSYARAKALGVVIEEVWDAALDGKTRPEHGALDGKKKNADGLFETSVGLIPGPMQSGIASFDIHCRCRIRAQIPEYPPGQRYVRGDGVKPWINYDEWRRSLSQKGKAILPVDSKAKQALSGILKQVDDAFSIPGIPEKARDIYERHGPNINVSKTTRVSHCMGKDVYLNERVLKSPDVGHVVRHEYAHAFDHTLGYFQGSARQSFIDAAKAANRTVGRSAKAAEKRARVIDYVYENKNHRALSDFMGSMTKNAIAGRWSHSNGYYFDYSRRTVEMFANLFDMYCTGDHWDFLTENFKNVVDEFMIIIGEI